MKTRPFFLKKESMLQKQGVHTIYANHPDGNFRHKYEMIWLA